MLTICIPARNEAAHIHDAVLKLARSLDSTKVDWKIIVSVNGSTDGTAERARQAQSPELRERLEVVTSPKAGKGAAIKYAADLFSVGRSVSMDGRGHEDMINEDFIFGFIDADLSADPDAIPGMVEKIINDQADIVIASRLMQARTTNRSWLRTVSSKFFNLAARSLLGINVKDAQCGLKLMNRRATELLANCKEDGWFLDIEFLAKAGQYGLRVVEVPVPWTEFRYPDRKSQIRHFRDGFEALRAMWRIREALASPEPGERSAA